MAKRCEMEYKFLIAVLLGCIGVQAGILAEVKQEELDARIQIVLAPFVSEKHELEFYQLENEELADRHRTLMKIDGMDFSGTDGSIPQEEIKSIKLLVGDKCFALPSESFQFLFNPLIESGTFSLEKSLPPSGIGFRTKDGLFEIAWSGGDGAGSYGVKFLIDLSTGAVGRQVHEFPESDTSEVVKFKLLKCAPSKGLPAPSQEL